MVAIEAVRVVGALGAALLDRDPALPGDVAGVGVCRARKTCARQRQDRTMFQLVHRRLPISGHALAAARPAVID
jgi:hypothetical protein